MGSGCTPTARRGILLNKNDVNQNLDTELHDLVKPKP